MGTHEKPTVFFDGACPLCRREIAFYRKRDGAEAVRWIDVSRCPDGEVAPGLSKQQALARFHLRDAAGNIVAGGRAFAALWQALPGLRFWGGLLARRPFVWLLDPAYSLFLKLRPRLQALAQRLERAR